MKAIFFILAVFVCSVAAEPYRFIVDEWGECTATCGGGTQFRAVLCLDDESGEIVSNKTLCEIDPINNGTIPPSQQACNTQPCPSWFWKPGNWTECTKPCDVGTQTRTLTCWETLADAPADESNCPSSKPPSQQFCNVERCPNYLWYYDGWTACNQSCGIGYQFRNETCEEEIDRVPLNFSFCLDAEPAPARSNTEQSCNTQPCPTYAWRAYPFGTCDRQCGGGVQTRVVACIETRYSETAPPSESTVGDAYCVSDGPRPNATQECNTQRCPEYYWDPTAWGPCSDPCKPPGYPNPEQTRTVTCREDISNQPVPASNCRATPFPEPASVQSCNTHTCAPLNETRFTVTLEFVAGSRSFMVDTYDTNNQVRDWPALDLMEVAFYAPEVPLAPAPLGGAAPVFQTQFVTTSTPGRYRANWELFEVGIYRTVVTRISNPIVLADTATTITPDVATAARCSVSGFGLSFAEVGIPASFSITVRDQYGNSPAAPGSASGLTVRARWTDGTGRTVIGDVNTSATPGVYDGWYLSTVSGPISLEIRLNGVNLPSTPRSYTVAPGPAFPPNCTASGLGLAGTGADVTGTFSVSVLDAYGNIPLLIPPSGWRLYLRWPDGSNPLTEGDPLIATATPGVYQASYKTSVAGNVLVGVELNGVGIAGSPFSVTIAPDAIDPARCFARNYFGKLIAGVPLDMEVVVQDRFGNTPDFEASGLHVSVDHMPTYVSSGFSQGVVVANTSTAGVFSATLATTVAGTKRVSVAVDVPLLNGTIIQVAVQGSPFEIFFEPAPVHVPSTTVCEECLGVIVAGITQTFNMTVRDVYGNSPFLSASQYRIRVRLEDEVGGELIGAVVPAFNITAPYVQNSGVFLCTFEPVRAAPVTIEVVLVGLPVTSIDAEILPFTDSDPIKTIAYLSPSDPPIVAGVPVSFIIQARDSFGNNQVRRGEGPWSVMFRHLEDQYEATGSAIVEGTIGGQYRVSFPLTVAGTYDVTISLDRTPSENIYQIRVVPEEVTDVSKTEISGHLGGPATEDPVRLVMRDRFGNHRTTGGDRVTLEWTHEQSGSRETEIGTDFGDATYEVPYRSTVVGDYTLDVRVNDVPVPDSPFNAAIVPAATHAPSSYAYGDGIVISTARERRNITIVAKDMYDNFKTTGGDPFEVKLIRNRETTALDVVDLNNGKYETFYIGTDEGGAMIVSITVNGAGVQESPFSVDVLGICEPGTFALTELGPCEICLPGTFTEDVNEKFCQRCPANTNSPPQATLQSLCLCFEGFYTLDGPGTECTECPDGAECPGKLALPYALPGYAPSSSSPTLFMECPVKDACLGGESFSCNDGYEGYLCNTCSPNYYVFNGKCLECKSDSSWIIALFLGVTWLFCGAIVLFNTKDRSENRFTTLAIGFNSIQVSALYAKLDIDWPPVANQIFGVFSLANFNIELASPECSIKSDNFFILKWYFFMIMPLLVVVLLFTWYTLMLAHYLFARSSLARDLLAKHPNWYKEPEGSYYRWTYKEVVVWKIQRIIWRANMGPRGLKAACVRSFHQLLVLVFLPLASQALSFMACKKTPEGKSYVDTMECYTSSYWSNFPFAVVFGVLYAIGIPAGLLALLKYKRSTKDPIKFELRYGFVVSRYIPERYYWEAWVLFRKLLVVIAVLFMDNKANVQLAFGCLLLGGFFALHQYRQPFRTGLHNTVESMSIAGSITTLFIGLVFKDGDHEKWLFDLCVLTSILATLLALAIAFSIDMKHLYQQHQDEIELEEELENEGFFGVEGDGAKSFMNVDDVDGTEMNPGFGMDSMDSEAQSVVPGMQSSTFPNELDSGDDQVFQNQFPDEQFFSQQQPIQYTQFDSMGQHDFTSHAGQPPPELDSGEFGGNFAMMGGGKSSEMASVNYFESHQMDSGGMLDSGFGAPVETLSVCPPPALDSGGATNNEMIFVPPPPKALPEENTMFSSIVQDHK